MVCSLTRRKDDTWFCQVSSFSLYMLVLQFFGHCQQENTHNNYGDKGVGLPCELFLQKYTGQQQGYDAHRGDDRSGDRTVTAEGVYIGELTGGFENSGQNFVFVHGNRAELNLLGLHENEQTQSKQSKGQLIAGIGNIFNGVFGHTDEGSGGKIVQIENIHKGAEGIQQRINKGHAEGDDGQFLTQILLSLGITLVFQEANAQNTDDDDNGGSNGDADPIIVVIAVVVIAAVIIVGLLVKKKSGKNGDDNNTGDKEMQLNVGANGTW